MHPLIEYLETRALYSVSPATQQLAASPSSAVVQPLVAAQKRLLGYWNGTLSIPGVHDRPVTIHITTQTHTGHLSGMLTTSLDPSIVVIFSGKVKPNGKLHVTLNGIHSGGQINGSGSAHVSASAHSMGFNMIFTQGGQGFPGTIALTRATAPTPPSTLPGGGGDDGPGDIDGIGGDLA